MGEVMPMTERFEAAQTLPEFIAGAEQNRALWQALYDRAQVEPAAVDAALALPSRRRLLVLLEDWCGDAVNVVPVLTRLAETVPERLELRVLGRDANPDLMDAHLSPTGGRAIPVVIVLDENDREIGWWGSRPAALQMWFEAEGRMLEKDERYRRIRAWYARDRGRSTVREVLSVAGGVFAYEEPVAAEPLAAEPVEAEPLAVAAV